MKFALLSVALYLSVQVGVAQTIALSHPAPLGTEHTECAHHRGPATTKSRPVREPLAPDRVSDYVRSTIFRDDRVTLAPLRSFTDQQGTTHDRYRLLVDGYPVAGATLVAHHRNGQVRHLNGEWPDPTSLTSDSIVLSSTAALEAALTARPAEQYAWEQQAARAGSSALPPVPELSWVPRAAPTGTPEYVLAYSVDLHAAKPLRRERVYVNAASGELLAVRSLLCHADEPGTAITSLSGPRNITCHQTGNLYRLHEAARGITTLDLAGSTDFSTATDFWDDDNHWDHTGNAQDDVATDVHWAMGIFHDLLEQFGWNGLDNNGHPMIGHVHYGEEFNNAFWDGTAASFGDGKPLNNIDLPVVSADIVGHEFAHAVIEFSAGLNYWGESAALNESFADILGYLTFRAGRGADEASWLLGAEVTSSGNGIRDMADPNAKNHPDTYGGEFWYDFNPGHTNSGVQNHWFYLLAEGGSGTNDLGYAYQLTGIGVENAARIAFRNLTVYLTESSDYADACYYSLLAAADLFGYGSEEYVQCAAAWRAVGLMGAMAAPVFTTDTLHLESTYFGSTQTRWVQFHNPGGDTLLLSDVTTETTHFQPDYLLNELLPYATDSFLLSFTPDTIGLFTDQIHLLTPAGNSTLVVVAPAIGLPTLEISETDFDLTLESETDTSLVALLANSGTGNLTWQVESITNGQPTEILIWTHGMYDQGGYDNLLAALDALPFQLSVSQTAATDAEVFAEKLLDNALLVLPHAPENDLYPEVSEIVQEFVEDGGLVLLLRDNGHALSDLDLLSEYVAGSVAGTPLECGNTDHPFLEDITLDTAPEPAQGLKFAGESETGWHSLIKSQNEAVFLAERSIGAGSVVYLGADADGTNEELQQLLQNIVSVVRPADQPDFVRLFSGSGFLLADTEGSFSIQIGSGSLPPGVYEIDIVLSTNDPAQPQIIISITLTITEDMERPTLAMTNYGELPDPESSHVLRADPENVRVHPNPVDTQLSVEVKLNQRAGKLTVRCYDTLGRCVLQQDWTDRREIRETLDLSRLSTGLYRLQFLQDGEEFKTEQLVVR